MTDAYGTEICSDCGKKYGNYSVGVSSIWMGVCDYCKQEKPVTEIRDWGHPKLPKTKKNTKTYAHPQIFTDVSGSVWKREAIGAVDGDTLWGVWTREKASAQTKT